MSLDIFPRSGYAPYLGSKSITVLSEQSRSTDGAMLTIHDVTGSVCTNQTHTFVLVLARVLELVLKTMAAETCPLLPLHQEPFMNGTLTQRYFTPFPTMDRASSSTWENRQEAASLSHSIHLGRKPRFSGKGLGYTFSIRHIGESWNLASTNDRNVLWCDLTISASMSRICRLLSSS